MKQRRERRKKENRRVMWLYNTRLGRLLRAAYKLPDDPVGTDNWRDERRKGEIQEARRRGKEKWVRITSLG